MKQRKKMTIVKLGKQKKKKKKDYVIRQFADGTKYKIKKSSAKFMPVSRAFCSACDGIMRGNKEQYKI